MQLAQEANDNDADNRFMLDPDVLEAGVARLADAWHHLRRERRTDPATQHFRAFV